MQCWVMVLQVVPLVLLLSFRGSDLLLELTTMSLSLSSIHRTIPVLDGRFGANTYFACKRTMLSSFLTVSRLLFVVGFPLHITASFISIDKLLCTAVVFIFMFVSGIYWCLSLWATSTIPLAFSSLFSSISQLQFIYISTLVICSSFSSSYYFTSFPLISQLSLKLGRYYRNASRLIVISNKNKNSCLRYVHIHSKELMEYIIC
jgi:hypothetical protein